MSPKSQLVLLLFFRPSVFYNISSCTNLPAFVAANAYVYDGLGFEARHCPLLPNEIKKLSFKIYASPKLA
jgi:hypothetical protein